MGFPAPPPAGNPIIVKFKMTFLKKQSQFYDRKIEDTLSPNTTYLSTVSTIRPNYKNQMSYNPLTYKPMAKK